MPSIGNIHYVLLFNKTSFLFLESSHSKKNMATQIHCRPMKNRAAITMDLVEEDGEFEEEEEEGTVLNEESSHLKRKKLNLGKKKGKNSDFGGGLGVVVQVKHCCQVEKCEVDLDGAKKYYKRHKVCQIHAKAPVVLVAGLSRRFCQQCSRYSSSKMTLMADYLVIFRQFQVHFILCITTLNSL